MAALIIKCQLYNRMLGTNLAPWELEKMPAEWETALETWAVELPRAREWRAKIDAAMDKLRAKKQ